MSNADDFKDRSLRERSLSPSHTVRISLIPHRQGYFTQDVSPPSVIRITPPHFHEDKTHTPQKVIYTSSLRHSTSRHYAVFLFIRIASLYEHRYKLLYENQARRCGIFNHSGIPYFKARLSHVPLSSFILFMKVKMDREGQGYKDQILFVL